MGAASSISFKTTPVAPAAASASYAAGETSRRGNSLRLRRPQREEGAQQVDADEGDATEEYEETEATETDFEMKTTTTQQRSCRPASGSPGSRPLVELESEKPLSVRLQTFRTRTVWTLILVLSFFIILAAGHLYCSLLVLALTVGVYQEVISLRQNDEKDKRLPLFFFLRWYWFCITIFATGSFWLFPLLTATYGNNTVVELIVSHHAIITYSAAFLGLMLFILSLRRFSLRYQFSQFALLLLTCILVVGQSMVQIANIYEALLWFFLSTSLVIVNDVFAYIFGVFFGKTRLLKLSPKKTVEGYVGASVVTLVWAMALSSFLSRFPVFTCPQEVMHFRPYSMWTAASCEIPAAFVPVKYTLPQWIQNFTDWSSFQARPVELHAVLLGVFAAFFAPFGGFFASGFKRALRIKDFGHSIPGHGGITDRFDCQIIMGMFTYLYVRTFVVRRFGVPTVAYLMKHARLMTHEDQLLLLHELTELLSSSTDTLSTS